MKAQDIFLYGLAALLIIGFFVIYGIMIYRQMNVDLMNGALIAAFSLIIGYFYGSSKGSSDKNKMLNEKG